jgi:DNA-binding GntR family transcriptional regulator
MVSTLKRRDRSEVSLTDRAYYTVRERILRGQLPPGTALSRRKLAEELGVSFLPISEALQRLEQDGLLESRPRAGTRVRTPTAEEVRGRSVVREALEAEAAKLCCERATYQERLELRRMGEQMDTLFARASEGRADIEFMYVVHQHHAGLHLRIADFARCPELKDAIEKNHVLIYNWFYDVAAEQRTLPEHFHAELAGAVTGDSPETADRVMRAHVRYGLPNTLKAVELHTAAGDWRVKR